MTRIFAALLALGLSLTGPAGAQPLWTDGAPDTGIKADTPVTFGAFSRLAKTASPAVVAITTETVGHAQQWGMRAFGPDVQMGAGSGFIIRADGYALTNNHVVEDARVIRCHLLDGREFNAEVVGTDPATDVAVLKLDTGGKKLPVVPLGDSDALDIGEWVVAIGNPMGLAHTVTAGIVSAKARREVRPDGRLRYADFIQTDASINPGNSGGPLFNVRGEVIGINTAINARAQGIGFAIPVNMVKTLLPSLVREGRVTRSWLGVQIQEITPDLARSFGIDGPRGALVAGLVENGPAANGGVREGDIITTFDGKPVSRHDDLPWLASTAGIGRTVPVEVMRDGRARTLQVKLGELPGSSATPARAEHPERPAPRTSRSTALGITIEEADKRVQQRYGVRGGAHVVAVDPGSVAARSGLRTGDVVVRANGHDVLRPADLVGVVDKVSAGQMIRLLVQREGGKAFIAFTR